MASLTPNNLITENSPYLLQHAYNPVAWNAWKPELLEEAKKQKKLLIISIGYAACHWCHVMEKESFENERIASFMNQNFINIKIDREEHPDIDQLYMNALQLMQNTGGWPLNMVALPDGRPFWGATYVKQDDWLQILQQLVHIYKTDTPKIYEYAEKLEKGLELFNLVEPASVDTISVETIKNTVHQWQLQWDETFGGNQGAPKFIMPTQFNFFLSYAFQTNNTSVSKHIVNSLTKIAYGGIFDVLGGGFSRYSVDEKWHIPHFEKMLYDNAQLISLYAKAYTAYKTPLFKWVIEKTIDFTIQDLSNNKDAYYASLDADSLLSDNTEKEEGAFYVWTKNELKALLKEDYHIFKYAYNINKTGYWENNHYVLYRTHSLKNIATTFQLTETEVENLLSKCNKILSTERNKRAQPDKDTKIITGWNALQITGFIDAYFATKTEDYLSLAVRTGNFISTQLTNDKEQLYRTLKTKNKITGYLEDYALTIEGFLKLFEATGNINWLQQSEKYTAVCLDEYYDTVKGLFYFSSSNTPVVVQRSIEKADNVIPASNSVMAHNLKKLGIYTGKKFYTDTYQKMLSNIIADTLEYPRSYTNWLTLALEKQSSTYEVIIVGDIAKETLLAFKEHYIPNAIFAISTSEAQLPIFKNRYKPNQTLIYVCKNNTCQLPVTTIEEAMAIIKAK
ncbi:thioredoxin domain-containing protein [Neptunitalea lumnitzerae]|uniref:Thioredoxin n=1 Tax=Neptunitalea lumnitzerae TaxID=2965509 RepID=A0ABQ5MMM0_9FLAO|nr:thioredoxin domain-containing protein [Neptunitalea sp. Y10]GLB50661.1 thioredoxin [Neptunitalea sp. Y10]